MISRGDKGQPEVSIAIPTCNGARYLETCLKSAMDQTFKDTEIVIVDDCSDDGTWAIIKAFARRDSRVRIHRNPSRLGLVRNWNRSIHHCTGEWIKFLFQDDLLDPVCIEKMLDAAGPQRGEKSRPFVVCERRFMIEKGVPESLATFYRRAIIPLSDIFPHEVNILPGGFSETLLEMGVGNNFIGEPSSVLMKRDLCVDYAFFNPNLVHLCDLEYWTRNGTNEGMVIVPEELNVFRIHPGMASVLNHSRRHFELTYLDRLVLLHDYQFSPSYENLRSHLGDEERLVRLLKRELDTVARVIEGSSDPALEQRFRSLLGRYPMLNAYFEGQSLCRLLN